MLSCQEITLLVSESLDRGVPLSQRLAMRLHLFMCEFCSRYRRHLLFLRHAIRRHPDRLGGEEEPSAASLSPDARERIKRALTREA